MSQNNNNNNNNNNIISVFSSLSLLPVWFSFSRLYLCCDVNKSSIQLDATNSDVLLISCSWTCFGRLYAHHQEVGMRFTAYGCLTDNILHTVHTSCHPTLQHHNSYNRTDNYRQWNSVRPLDDGHKDTRNMLRYYWLPINHYLLHLVGSSLYLVIKDSRLYEGKVCVVMLVGAWD